MLNNYLAKRRGVLEHLQSGRMTRNMYVVFDVLLLLADKSTGIWTGNAQMLASQFGAGDMSRREARRILTQLESAGYIKRFATKRSHSAYPILIARYLCTFGPRAGMFLDIENTRDGRFPMYQGGLEEPKISTGGPRGKSNFGLQGGLQGGLEESQLSDLELVSRMEVMRPGGPTGGPTGGPREMVNFGLEVSPSQEVRSKALILENKNKKTSIAHAQLKTLSDAEFAAFLKEHPQFGEFWEAYTRPVGKKVAARAWLKAMRSGADPAAILAGLAHWVRYWEQTGRKTEHIPHPTTFLHNHYWEEIPKEHQGGVREAAADRTERETSQERKRRRNREAIAAARNPRPLA